jgi:Ca2+/Na+ antiporter
MRVFIAARGHHTEIALGTVFGGGSFIVCVALGLGAVLFPCGCTCPVGCSSCSPPPPVLAGVALIGATTARLAGVALLAAIAASIWYLVRASRRHGFLGEEAAEIRDEAEKSVRWWRPVGLAPPEPPARRAGRRFRRRAVPR